jgi:ankyrin repeat protein
MLAVSSGVIDVVHLLWSRSDLNAMDARGRGLLHRAAAGAMPELCEKLLVEARVPVNVCDTRRSATPLHLAAAAQSPIAAMKTIQVGLDPFAAIRAQMLIEHGAQSQPDSRGLLPGDWSAACGRDENLTLLCRHFGAQAVSANGMLVAAANGHAACVTVIAGMDASGVTSVDRMRA